MIFFDASIVREPFNGMHGITRVELEILRHFVGNEGVRFLDLAAIDGKQNVPRQEIEDFLSKIDSDFNHRKTDVIRKENFLLGLIGALKIKLSTTRGIRRLLMTVPFGLLIQGRRLLTRIVGDLRLFWIDCKNLLLAERHFAFRSTKYSESLGSLVLHKPYQFPVPGFLEQLSSEDVIFSAGLLFKRVDTSVLASEKKISNFNLVVLVHDLIPVKFPHLTFRNHLPDFYRFYADILQIADSLVVYSEATKKDITQYASKELYLNEIKATKLNLGFDHLLNPDLESAKVEELIGRKYILFVSTIERRKNHEVLYKAYSHAVDIGKRDHLPTLVIVGQFGWGYESIVNDLEVDPSLQNSRGQRLVLIFNTVTDSELKWLYENCHFTVFPSFYEGWGLPITESHLHGRFVIASNGGAIPEASQGLALNIDPKDSGLWAKEILKHAKNDRKTISARSKINTWEEFSGDLWQLLNSEKRDN